MTGSAVKCSKHERSGRFIYLVSGSDWRVSETNECKGRKSDGVRGWRICLFLIKKTYLFLQVSKHWFFNDVSSVFQGFTISKACPYSPENTLRVPSKIDLKSITYKISFLRPILDRFLTLQDVSKTPPRHLKTLPRRLQDAPKPFQRRSRMAPRRFERLPKQSLSNS